MNKKTRIVWSAAAAVMTGILSCTSALADNAISIDMTDYNDEAWSQIAMANDDTVETGIIIRSSASEASKAVGYLYRGGAVYVISKGDAWTEVTSGDVTGYVRNEYLTYGTEAKGLAEHYGTYGAKAAWDDINIFSEEDGSASVVATASDGEIYKLNGKDGSWLELDTASGAQAYVPAEDMSVVMVVDTAAPAGEEKTTSADAFSEIGSSAGEHDTAASSTDRTDDGQAPSQEASGADTSEAVTAQEDDSYSEEAAQSDYAYEETRSDVYDTGTAGSDQDAAYDESGTSSEAAVSSESDYSDDGESAWSETETAGSTVSSDTSGSADQSGAQSQASALYTVYLEAQAAADAAVSNGAGEEEIYATAQAATDAYAAYVAAQNAADAAYWGVSTDSYETGSSDQDTSSYSTDSGTTSYEDGSGTEVISGSEVFEEDSYETEPSAEQTQTEPAADTSSESSWSGATSQASSSDLELLAALIYCEAGNQPYEGQVAVGAVVMNRVNSSSFPSSVYDVIYQSGQFTPAYSGALASALANGSGSAYLSAAQDAMSGVDPTGGALYFNTSHGSGVQIGAHWFY